MRKIIILLLCCGVLVSMVGCGGNTAPLPTKSPPTTVSETIITEKTSSITAVEPTEKEKEPVPIESKDQETEPTVAATEPTITVEPTEETKPTETEGATVTNTAEEKVTPPIKETVPKVTKQESTEKSAPFNIDQWITFAKEYLMVYADDAKQGWITKRSIDDMRSMFGNEIFRGEQYRLFEMQTEQREFVKERFRKLIEHYEQNGYELPPPVNDLFLKLAEQLKSVKGKKVYGYLPKEIKETVDKIVAELAKDSDVAKLYSKWNEINREKLSLYHEKKTPDIPLEDNKEFRSIKNVIVKAAVEFNNTQHSEGYTPRQHTASAFGKILCQLL